MVSLSQSVTNEIIRIGRASLIEVRQRTVEDQSTVFLRRLRSSYDRLSLEEIGIISQALGHQDTEERPCKACKIIAQKEFDLAED